MIVGATQKESPIKFDYSIPVSITGKNNFVKPLRQGYNRYLPSKMSGEDIGLYIIEGKMVL